MSDVFNPANWNWTKVRTIADSATFEAICSEGRCSSPVPPADRIYRRVKADNGWHYYMAENESTGAEVAFSVRYFSHGERAPMIHLIAARGGQFARAPRVVYEKMKSLVRSFAQSSGRPVPRYRIVPIKRALGAVLIDQIGQLETSTKTEDAVFARFELGVTP